MQSQKNNKQVQHVIIIIILSLEGLEFRLHDTAKCFKIRKWKSCISTLTAVFPTTFHCGRNSILGSQTT